jgi:two-component system, cell cycle response regulator DivK
MRQIVPVEPSPWTPSFVLLVDRHDDTRIMYAQYLQLKGCAVEHAVDGREALVKALTQAHDAIVTETHLSGIDGYQLCELLRRDPLTKRTPLVVVTADAQRAAHDRARAAGADAVLVKPCLPDLILAELRRLAAGARAPMTPVTPDERHANEPPSAAKRIVLSHVHKRGDTTSPPLLPPSLLCPVCDEALVYDHSHVGGVSARNSEQWDYYECPGRCGTFEYRQRTRRVARLESGLERQVIRPPAAIAGRSWKR